MNNVNVLINVLIIWKIYFESIVSVDLTFSTNSVYFDYIPVGS